MSYGRFLWEVIGYTWFASIYCKSCGDTLDETDPEGNPRHPIFLDNDWAVKDEKCSTCGANIE